MRENHRLPETRDFPAWKDERRAWFSSAEEVVEEEWMLSNGDHLRVVAQPLPDGGLRLFLEDRTEQVRLASARDTLLRVRAATFDNLFEAISVFASDGRLYLWNRRFCQVWDLDEEWLREHPRVDELVPAMARKLVNPTAAAQVRERPVVPPPVLRAHDARGGGFFRTTTGADWTQPHREKLLHEHAGLLANYVHAFRLTGRSEYRAIAGEMSPRGGRAFRLMGPVPDRSVDEPGLGGRNYRVGEH